MDRVNVTLDDVSRSAGAFLAHELGAAGLSAAIRYALIETAKRKGWRADRVPPKRRGSAARTGEGE